MAHADPSGHRQALRILVGPDGGIDELVGDCACEFLPVIVCDELQHQVDRGSAARGGEGFAVGDEDGFRQRHVLEFLDEAVLVFPVDGRLLAVQKSGLCQGVSRGTEPADRDAAPGFAAKPVQQGLRGCGADVDAAANDDGVVARCLSQIVIELERGSGGTGGGLAAFADHFPFVKRLAGHPIGDPQAFDRACVTEKRELIQKDEDEAPRLVGRFQRDGLNRDIGHRVFLLRQVVSSNEHQSAVGGKVRRFATQGRRTPYADSCGLQPGANPV